MNQRHLKGIAMAMMLAVLGGLGCNRTVPPPTPFADTEVAGEIEKAFAADKPAGTKELATEIVTALQAKNFGKAFEAIQNLSVIEGLSKEQGIVTSRAMMTISALLQNAQTQGDTQAAQALDNYIRRK